MATSASFPPASPTGGIHQQSFASRLDKLSSAKTRYPSHRFIALGLTLILLVVLSMTQNQVLLPDDDSSSASSPQVSLKRISSPATKQREIPEDRKSYPGLDEQLRGGNSAPLTEKEEETQRKRIVAGDGGKERIGEDEDDDEVPESTATEEETPTQEEDGSVSDEDETVPGAVAITSSSDADIVSTPVEEDFPPLDESEEKDPSASQLPVPERTNPLLNPDKTSDFYRTFYQQRFLPPPQLDFFPKSGRQIKYQMHNCLKGRDGSKAGLLNAGIPRVKSQQSIENMPVHIIDPFASIMIACNAKLPMYRLTRNPDIAGKRLISSAQGLLSKLCLGSMKHKQLECRRALSERWGCSYESLSIQPAQYILDDPKQCEAALEAGKQRDRSWLSKPSGGIRGRGIRYFATTEQLEKEITSKGGCSKSNSTGIRGRLVQEYVSRPALIDGKFKFDVRTWLLIASVDPLVIFYHEGFVRVARQPYNERSKSKMVHVTNARGQEERLAQAAGADQRKKAVDEGGETDEEDGKYMRSFDHVSEQLHRVHGLPKDFMQNSFRKQMMRAQTFAALAQYTNQEDPPDLLTKRGFYQIYACDSMVDRDGRAHLLECNGFPAEAQQTAVTGREVWGEMIALVLNLHVEPWRLMKDSTPPPGLRRTRYIREGVWKTGPQGGITNGEAFKANSYAFGGWHLCFNELETPIESFNVCKV